MAKKGVMQALDLVRISKKHNFIEISLDKFLECKKMGLGRLISSLTAIAMLNFYFFLFYLQFIESLLTKVCRNYFLLNLLNLYLLKYVMIISCQQIESSLYDVCSN